MMRYRLRTLLIVLALGPPLLAGAIWGWLEIRRLSEMSRIADRIILSGDDQGKLPPFPEP